MLAPSKLLINQLQLRLVRVTTLVLVTLALPISWATEVTLQANDLINPKRLLEYRYQASPEDRARSDKMYQYAMEATKKDWASAVKSFAESVLAYPNSRALVKMAESRLRMLVKKDLHVKLKALDELAKYLNSALALNKVDPLLNRGEQQQIEHDKACIEQYLVTSQKFSDCRPLDWINL